MNGVLAIEQLRIQRLILEDADPGAWYWRLRLAELPKVWGQ